jgi:hypothetical protein
MGQAEAQLALNRLAAILESEGLPYAIIGAFALNEYGHRRVTVDVDLVMREEHLAEFKRRHLGNGYAERVPGTGRSPKGFQKCWTRAVPTRFPSRGKLMSIRTRRPPGLSTLASSAAAVAPSG